MSTLSFAATASPVRVQLREAARFVAALALFLSPLLVCYGLLEAIAWHSGETWSMRALAQWHSNNPELLWRTRNPTQNLPYKLARVALLKPDAILLGNSHSVWVTSDTMRPYSFYNSGVTAWTFDQYFRYLELITARGYAPKVLFFNLDYFMFSDAFADPWQRRFVPEPPTHWEDLKATVDVLLTEPARLFRSMPYGAVWAQRGFRADGSGYETGLLSNDPKRVDLDIPEAPGAGFDVRQITAFERFVSYAKSKGIALVGIAFPLYGTMLDALNRDPHAGIWREFESDKTRAYFASAGILFFDYADMAEYRDKPEHFHDSLHPDGVVTDDVMHRVLGDRRIQALLPNLEKER